MTSEGLRKKLGCQDAPVIPTWMTAEYINNVALLFADNDSVLTSACEALRDMHFIRHADVAVVGTLSLTDL